MHTKTISTLFFLAMLFLTTSCGRQSTAESIVKEFVETNALHPEKMQGQEFMNLDSTKFVTDSLVLAMQENGNELYKKDIAYAAKTSGRMLYFLRMKYVYEGDTLRNTFYLDEQLQTVVSFK